MIYAGIDVAADKKGQALALISEDLRVLHLSYQEPAEGLAEKVIGLACGEPMMVGIDAPRSPAPDNSTGKWGRQCDREVHKLGTPVQWTPPASYFVENPGKKAWMEVGFRLFEDFARLAKKGWEVKALEAFPSANYGRFGNLMLPVPFGLIHRKAKTDQLDALCCALVAWCHKHGRSEEVGDPEEGTMVLPVTT